LGGLRNWLRYGPAQNKTIAPSGSLPLLKLVRCAEWWEVKLLPACAVLLATALLNGVPADQLLVPLVELIASLATGAAFVSLLNDWTDREDDARAGKFNQFSAAASLGSICLVLSILLGAAWLWWFAARPWVASTFAVGWVAYAAYSLRPLRLKARGLPGLMCDAIGAHLVPALMAVGLATDSAGDLSSPWIAAVAVWSLALGIRGIIAHQRADAASDRAAGVGTYVVGRGSFHAQWLVRRLIFPVEIAGLGAVLYLLGSDVVLLALPLALLFQMAKIARFRLDPVLTSPSKRAEPIMADFYLVFLPLALLLEIVLRQPAYVGLTAVYLLLFPLCVTKAARDMARLLFEVLK
jgi:hypothetical protein